MNRWDSRNEITRREILHWGMGLLAASAMPSMLRGGEQPGRESRRFNRTLPIPPVLKPVRTDATTDYYQVTQRESEVEILPGLRTKIWGYEGIFPGPTIRARRGRRVVIHHTNYLAVPTVVHLHGSASPPDSDGFPTDLILPGQTKAYTYPNDQPTATLWYHDHAMAHTGRNIYMGLAGLYLIQDEEEEALGLPRGPYDVPLLIQDRKFTSNGSFAYRTRDHLGAEGGVILVNGTPWPQMTVAARKYRFRIVNGCNATPLRLALSSGKPFIQIATDGGLLPTPVSCVHIPLAMAERVEAIIDFSDYPIDARVVLQNLDTKGATGPVSDEIIQFRVARHERDDSSIPTRLSELSPINVTEAKVTRDFVFSAKPTFGVIPIVNWTINGRAFDPDHPIAAPAFGDVEVWRFTNRRFIGRLSMVHPVHLHLVRFLVLERNGRPPLPHERGWKDTVAVDKDDVVSVIARFDHYRGRYLLHCHNLEHEDHSMMARFDVA